MDLNLFIDKYKEEALKIKLYTNAINVLAGYREAITEPDFEAERQNAIETAKEMVVQQKKRLRNFISLNFEGDRLGRYIGGTPPHLLDLRIYLEYKELLSLEERQKAGEDNNKIAEKYYAFYHWVLIEMGKENVFEKNRFTDKYDKQAIMKYGKEKYKFKSQGQDFYYKFIHFDLTRKEANAKEYGKGYKNILIAISKNDADVISHLKKYPN